MMRRRWSVLLAGLVAALSLWCVDRAFPAEPERRLVEETLLLRVENLTLKAQMTERHLRDLIAERDRVVRDALTASGLKPEEWDLDFPGKAWVKKAPAFPLPAGQERKAP